MSRVLAVVFAVYLVVVDAGVFGPGPGRPVNRAGEALRRVDQKVRSEPPDGSSGSRPFGPIGPRPTP